MELEDIIGMMEQFFKANLKMIKERIKVKLF